MHRTAAHRRGVLEPATPCYAFTVPGGGCLTTGPTSWAELRAGFLVEPDSFLETTRQSHPFTQGRPRVLGTSDSGSQRRLT